MPELIDASSAVIVFFDQNCNGYVMGIMLVMEED